jgi:glycosyltransferase involved in cell wall biosynthesis
MEVVKRECDLLGISMPPGHEHAEDQEKVDIETEEYELTDRLLCPSDFVARTFIDSGYSWERLARHQYGFDEKIYYPTTETRNPKLPFSMLFVGGCAPRKGLHYALDAWLQSPAHKDGRFLIAGAFIPEYQEKLRSMLSHPSVEVLGHRNDIPELMRGCDVLVLPTVEEGSALVTSEARGSGCVLLVSDAAGAVCEHMENALIHRAGDVCSLTQHITLLYENRDLLGKLRRASLLTRHEITWKAAGIKLLQVYQEIIASQRTDKRYSCSAEQFPL